MAFFSNYSIYSRMDVDSDSHVEDPDHTMAETGDDKTEEDPGDTTIDKFLMIIGLR